MGHPVTGPQTCTWHPGRPTALSCSRCGQLACPECLRAAPVGQHCVDCVAREAATVRVGTAPQVAADAAHRTPVVTYALIAVNVVVFALCMWQGAGIVGASPLMEWGVLSTGFGPGFRPDVDFEYWRLVTSGFLHWSVPHIALNMISLYIIGRDLERLFGPLRYGAIYLASLLGGSAAVLLLQPGVVATAGASGAIYGLMGALLIVVLRLKLPATSILVVIGLNVAMSVTIPGISIWAHLGGLLFGALSTLAVLWLPTAVLPAEQRTADRVSRVGAIALVALLVIAAGIGVGLVTAYSV
ncbi:MAG: rhomboid family intramembrane serine protease [Gordonia sp. (in: high G+C Gram-positive bacteria)]|uniref:rhomboid family intramembrane serine protease n=1 Tax=Gordonia sp. (in: high G+C Gram-positive bacteria) TaxID=84139 RepID=UPI003BB7BDC6